MPLSFGAIVVPRLYNFVYIFHFPLCTHTMRRPLVRVTENMVVFFKEQSQPISALRLL